MSEFKCTPAPWSRNGNAVFNDDGYAIVHLTYGEYTGIKEDEANTNLIAAAPELLEALQSLLATQILPDFHAEKFRRVVVKALGQ